MTDLDRLFDGLADRIAARLDGTNGPVFVTRHNCETVLGLPWRTVRDWTKSPHFPPIAHTRGKTIMVELEPLLALIRAQDVPLNVSETDEADGADGVLREVLGADVVRLVGGSR